MGLFGSDTSSKQTISTRTSTKFRDIGLSGAAAVNLTKQIASAFNKAEASRERSFNALLSAAVVTTPAGVSRATLDQQERLASPFTSPAVLAAIVLVAFFVARRR